MKLTPSQTFLIFKSYLISFVHLCLDIANVRNVSSILGATDVMLFTHLLDYFGGFFIHHLPPINVSLVQFQLSMLAHFVLNSCVTPTKPTGICLHPTLLIKTETRK